MSEFCARLFFDLYHTGAKWLQFNQNEFFVFRYEGHIVAFQGLPSLSSWCSGVLQCLTIQSFAPDYVNKRGRNRRILIRQSVVALGSSERRIMLYLNRLISVHYRFASEVYNRSAAGPVPYHTSVAEKAIYTCCVVVEGQLERVFWLNCDIITPYPPKVHDRETSWITSVGFSIPKR